MKTLIESTETSATYEFSHNDCVRTVIYDAQEMRLDGNEIPDFAEMADKEHASWLEWLGVGNQ